MSGKGGIEESLLPIGIGIAGSIAAPYLAPMLLGETVGASAAGVALTGAGLGGAGAAVTGRDPLMGALTGGIGGFTAGGGFSDMFGGAVAPEAFDYASEAYAPTAFQGVGATTPNIAPAQPVLADYYAPVATPVAAPTDLTQGGVDLSDLGFAPRPGPNVSSTGGGIMDSGAFGEYGGADMSHLTPGVRLPTSTAGADLTGSGLRMAPTGTEATSAVDTASLKAREAMAAAPGKGIAGKEPSWWSGLSNTQKAGIIGAGGIGAYSLIKRDNERYGAPPTQEYTGPLSKFSYDPSRFTPTYATPNVYRPSYAEGGTVEQMSRNNAIGANQNFPQSSVGNTLRFSSPINTPMPDNVLGGVGAGVDPYTGAQRFAAGGLAATKAFAVGGTTGVYDPRTMNYVDPMADPNDPASTMGGMQQQNIVDVLAAQKAQQEAFALQYGNDGGVDGSGNSDNAGTSSGNEGGGAEGAGGDSDGLAKGGIAAAAPSNMQAIDDYMSSASKEGGMQALMAKAKAGDYNAIIAMNKLRKTPNENYAAGGHLGGYSDGGRMLKGPGDGMSDDIPASIAGKQPARLADNEFVVPADVVSHLGNGSSDAGAKKLYSMMDKVRKARTGRKKQSPAIKADKYMPA